MDAVHVLAWKAIPVSVTVHVMLSEPARTSTVTRDARLHRFGDFRFRRVVFVLLVPARFFGRFRATRSGSFALPVSRFHSSNVSGEILPFTRSSANLRRCAWLLNGIASYPVRHSADSATSVRRTGQILSTSP